MELGGEIVVLGLEGLFCFSETICSSRRMLVGQRLERYCETYAESPASSSRVRSFVTPSRPSRKESRDLDMCPSWEFGSRFSEIARCRSRRESLTWSARRNSWFGFDMVVRLSLP